MEKDYSGTAVYQHMNRHMHHRGVGVGGVSGYLDAHTNQTQHHDHSGKTHFLYFLFDSLYLLSRWEIPEVQLHRHNKSTAEDTDSGEKA